MLVVSNTSPISNLAVIGRLSLLRSQFHEIWIPGVVQSELHQLSDPAALQEIQQALQDGWIKPQGLREDKVARLLAAALDPGEAEAIALALELSADLILLDERDGRSAAERAARVGELLPTISEPTRCDQAGWDDNQPLPCSAVVPPGFSPFLPSLVGSPLSPRIEFCAGK
jgi:predicted nucleic acid-binding protein